MSVGIAIGPGYDDATLQDMSTGAVGSNAYIDATSSSQAAVKIPSPGSTLEEVEGLLYVHPEYADNEAKWVKYMDCYASREVSKYIHKHLREHDSLYLQRLQRGYYYNYVASIVDLIVSYIYHAPLIRKTDDKLYGELYKDADLTGTEFTVFMEAIATFAQVCGHTGVLVDMPKVPEGIKSEEDRKLNKLRPYLTIIHALQIKDWEVDRFGNFEWVKIEVDRPQNRNWKTAVDEDIRTFIIWTKQSWEEWQVTGSSEGSSQVAEKTDGGEHNLGEVPLVIVRNERRKDHKWMGISSVRDITDINIAIINWCSLGDEEIFERCLNVLAMERGIGDTPATLSQHNILEYEPGAEPPKYLTPGESPLDLIAKWIERGKDEIYRLGKLGGSQGLMGQRQATSGIAYAFEFNETNQALGTKAQSLQQGEVDIHRLYAKWLNKTFDGSVEYPTEFGVDDFIADFGLLADARTTLTSETAIKELELKITSKMFHRESQEVRKKIAAEIEAGNPRTPGFTENMLTIPQGLRNQTADPTKREKSGEATTAQK